MIYFSNFLRGYVSRKIYIFFKELTPHSRIYELHGQGKKKKKKKKYKIKKNKHLTLSYKLYLQNQQAPPYSIFYSSITK